jgi:hypothetical protein
MMRRPLALLLSVALVATGAVVAVGNPVAATPTSPLAPTGSPPLDPGDLGPEAFDEGEYDLGVQAFAPRGFPARVELTAKVYAPTTIVGRAPLVVLQHGRHATCANDDDQLLQWPCPATVPSIPSYRGYDALGANLASHGAIVVSISANGINANDGFLDDGGAAARAELILEHLRRWQAWDAAADGSPFGDRFVGHVDLDRVGLMGHSRGGEGVAAAISLNQRIGAPFGIEAAVALAPVDFGRRIVGGTHLGIVLPYCDGDVSDLQGASYYDDGRYASPGDPTSKSTYLLYGANHNFFNTVWTSGPGSFDDAGFFGELGASATGSALASEPCSPGGPGRLTAGQQEQAGATLMAGFLRRYLDPEPALAGLVTGSAPIPASAAPARWSTAHHAPDRLDVESWSSLGAARRNELGQLAQLVGPSPGLVCNATEGFGWGGSSSGVVATPCATTEGLAGTNDTGVLDVGWVQQRSFVRQPLSPAGTDVTGYDGLRLRVAVLADSRNAARARQDFSIVLEDADGARASVAASQGTNGLQRLNAGMVRHAVLNGVRIPLASFGGIDLTRVRAVELRFDRTGAGRLALSDLAFTQEGTGASGADTVGPANVAPPKPACRGSNANRWACAVVQLLYGRDPSSSELATYARSYGTAEGRRQAISRIVNDPRARRTALDPFAQRYAQAAVDPGLVDASLSTNGRRWWQAARVDLASNLVYTSPSLSAPDQLVAAAYESFLGRPADPAGLAYWTPRVAQQGPAKLAANLAATATHRGRLVEARYVQILGRTPDPSGRSYWTAKLAAPGGEQALVASLLATESFRAWAVH